jgi:signal transduction histidine kinase
MKVPNQDSSRVALVAGAFVAALGAIVLVGGWWLGIEVLKGAGTTITMKTNAAIGLLACGTSLFCAAMAPPRRGMSLACASIAGALGAATLCQHLFGWNLRIDELLFTEAAGAAATTSPNRMGPNASASFILYSAALISLHLPGRKGVGRAQVLAAVACVLAIVPLVGYLYGAQELYGLARITGIAVHTAGALLLLGIGILCVARDAGPVATFFSTSAGGVMTRRLAIPMLVLPVLLGYFRVWGERANLYDGGLGTALLIVCLTVAFWVVVWRTGVVLDTLDAERETALTRERTARADAERAVKLKDEFIASLSHELRTPLNAILGWTQLLRDGIVPSSNRQKGVDVIARNGEMLGRLVEDLLDISRISAGHLQLDLRSVDVGEVVQETLESFAPSAAARGVELRADIGAGTPPIAADAERLRQIVRNLLSNAVKFTRPGGCILVSVVPAPGGVDLRVSDTGEGIEPSFLPHVFERFRQEDPSSTRQHGGLGLGLAIVRDLTVLHGGRVEAASGGKGKGTTITVTLPHSPMQVQIPS